MRSGRLIIFDLSQPASVGSRSAFAEARKSNISPIDGELATGSISDNLT